jgi:hypothetical protein
MPQWVLVTVVLLAQLFSSRAPSGSSTVDVRADRPTPTITLTSLTITPPDQIVPVGGLATYQAIGTFSDGTSADITNTLNWTLSSLPEATLIAPGHVHGLNTGTVTIAASSGGLMAHANLVVRR